jgi:hypothetical protein
MRALVAILALVVLPAAVAHFAWRSRFVRTQIVGRFLVPIIVFVLVAAADWVVCADLGLVFAHYERIAGPYRLVAFYANELMIVCYGRGGACVPRVLPTVFAVGANDTYVVAARHPGNGRDLTEYFYIIRALDGAGADPSIAVRGPFTEAEYRLQETRLGLPSFTRTVETLR